MMKGVKRILYLIIICLTSMVCSAQYTRLFDFLSTTTGRWPYAALISDGTFLYGTTQLGGSYDNGTIFRIKPDGSSFSLVHDFGNGQGWPLSSLIYDGVYFYGTTWYGGQYGQGAVFRLKPDGSSYSILVNFDNTVMGRNPLGTVVSDGINLYGMTNTGGTYGIGTLYKVKNDGSGFTVLINFMGASNGNEGYGSLIYDGIFLYGMTRGGGINAKGTIFKVKTDGSNYTKLLDLDSAATGSIPSGSLISDGTYLYGMTSHGGPYDFGTIFKIKPDGTGFIKLLDFSGTANGRSPNASLIYDGTFLYGMTSGGGTANGGTIFKIKTDGSSYIKLLDFNSATGGIGPCGDLLLDGTTLYGTTRGGGLYSNGTVFKYELVCNIPSLQANGLTFTNVTSNSVTINWTNGNGARRIVKIKPTNTFSAPVNGNDYTANTVYSGSGEQVVYNGTGNSVTVTGLLSSHWYWFRVYEASCSNTNSLYLTSAGTGNPRRVLTLPYQIPNRPEELAAAAGGSSIAIYPNPTTSSITLESADNNLIQQLTLYSMDGKLLKSIRNQESEIINIDMQELSAGIYFLDCLTENGSEMRKVVKY
jgi:uncharacterized repeat protein (TIGR03803 family)